MQRRSAWIVIVGALAIVFCAGLALARLRSSKMPYLFPEHGAEWIHFKNPEIEVYIGDVTLATAFRKRFPLAEDIPHATLTFRTMKNADVYLNGQPIYRTDPQRASWKMPETIAFDQGLPAGDYELLFIVSNRNGPQCLLAYSDELPIATGAGWEASRDPKVWTPAIAVDAPHAYAVSQRFPRADEALLSLWYLFVPLFLLVSIGGYFGEERRRTLTKTITPATIRWVLVAAFLVLGVNNLFKLPQSIGFDIEGHMAYIKYVAKHWRVPLASDGWTMFQAPLFYLVCAPIFRVLTLFLSDDQALRALRIVPVICGALHIELCYRAVRLVWNERPGLQIFGTTLGALLPLHIYVSQYLGNESFSGVFGGVTVVLLLHHLYPGQGPDRRTLAATGIAWGCALLSKVTAVLLGPGIVYTLAVRAYASTEKRLRRALKGAAVIFGVAFVVAGWYFIRNWILIGKPFYGGWEPERGIIWWQDPGYRTLHQFATFGAALFHPVCANMNGFWDGLYATFWSDGLLSAALDYEKRPPWNYRLMLPGVWLGMVPTAMLLAGACRTFGRSRERRALILSTVCVATFLAGILYTFATVPYYCVVKSSYMTGLLPCFAVLGAAGFDVLGRRRVIRAALLGAFACWALAAYGAYFVW